MTARTLQTDTLIIGCGIAGAAAALRLSDDPSHHIIIVTRSPDADDSSSAWAQGGIVTRGLDDTPHLLINDILRAGAGLSAPQAAQVLAEEGSALVQSVLVERCGVRFDRDESGEMMMGLEGAHSTRRVVHVGDRTGKAIISGMLRTLSARPNVTLLTEHTALELILDREKTCRGALLWATACQDWQPVLAGQVILATGGAGQIYSNTSNPIGARGDGMAMAWRAGAQLANMEYTQFHPTTLSTGGAFNLLVSEALRGEGAILLTPQGEPFMARYSPQWRDLAPRDVVARAIHVEMQIANSNHVLLDIASQRPAAYIRQRFPQLVENCARLGLDATTQPLPVVPAAHYFCGGIRVDLWGKTSIPGLYAVGEVSCTGLHGANRLASTSLLEGLVWGDRSARHIRDHRRYPRPSVAVTIPEGLATTNNEIIQTLIACLKTTMWQSVGLIRDKNGLHSAQQTLSRLEEQIEALYVAQYPNDALIGLRNMVQIAQLVTTAALRNRYSWGVHYRADALNATVVA